jgi:hypothetical protein
MHIDETNSAEMVRELGLDPALDLDDNPLLEQARRNVADTVEQAHERAREHAPDRDEDKP